ncbi:single-stranded-DNA-specific exonuclease RecJ [candidate division WWE3 bacterium]|jgi:single-stranded-DNA-specific exonuclease|nr:single-stranded-DNA-specific exonuclease RecJ [candidate division WWE3 bacterium]MBT7349503.1 single-stranded-DNA-specific exonuclease RecJ [candidate division WWE3 bacterium]
MLWNIQNEFKDTDNLLDLLLENRGIISKKDVERFLTPPPIFELLKELPKEFKNSASQARDFIQEAVDQKLPIIVHGDYDADGICATAILTSVLREDFGHEKTYPFIPNRFDHGYGITPESIDACIEKISGDIEGGLLITVDAGITAVEAVAYAKEKGLKVIITDHHQKPKKLPKADCIVWNDEFVGAGIAWVLGRIMATKNTQLLALAALATVTDLQPVTGYNRAIVKEGLMVLNTNPPIGLKILHRIAGRAGKEITTYDLGWVFGPRINATGRIGDAQLALDLLLEKDEVLASEYAQRLNSLNMDRQDKTMDMYNVVGELDKDNLPRVIVTSDQNYHEGIIGLVAAKLVQTYYRPAIVISLEGDLGKGSVRSVKGVNIIDFLREFEDMFDSLGGHPMAAGFSIKANLIPELEKRINLLAEEQVLDEYLIPSLDVDVELPLDIVDIELLSEVEGLKPFGIGNKTPVFVSKEVTLTGFDIVGRDSKHLTLKLLFNGKNYRGIFFGKAYMARELTVGDLIDIAYTAEKNEYNGRTYVNIVIKDLILSEK